MRPVRLTDFEVRKENSLVICPVLWSGRMYGMNYVRESTGFERITNMLSKNLESFLFSG